MRKTLTTAWILLSLTVLLAGCGNRKTVSDDPNGRITDNSTVTAPTGDSTRNTTRYTEKESLPTTKETTQNSLLPDTGDNALTDPATDSTEGPVNGRQRKPRMMKPKGL